MVMSDKLSVKIEIGGIKEFESLINLLTVHYSNLPSEVQDALMLMASKGFAAEFSASDFHEIKGDDELSHLVPTIKGLCFRFMRANRITKEVFYCRHDDSIEKHKFDSFKLVMKSGREIVLW